MSSYENAIEIMAERFGKDNLKTGIKANIKKPQ